MIVILLESLGLHAAMRMEMQLKQKNQDLMTVVNIMVLFQVENIWQRCLAIIVTNFKHSLTMNSRSSQHQDFVLIPHMISQKLCVITLVGILSATTTNLGLIRLRSFVIREGHEQCQLLLHAFNKTQEEYSYPPPRITFADNPIAEEQMLPEELPSIQSYQKELHKLTTNLIQVQ